VRRFAVVSTFGSVVGALALVGAVASIADAGWRSADRRALEDDDEVVIEEPFVHEHEHIPDDPRRMLHRDLRDEPLRQAPAGAGTQPYWGTTQPYWGTMRPYWNAGEPPGVIHRQPRTAPLKVRPVR
jgi:hypothetical protein